MIELPEAVTLARQVTASLTGRRVVGVVAAASPHRFAWYTGKPETYAGRLTGRTITGATSHGGIVEIAFGDLELRLNDGAHPRLRPAGAEVPAKHQLRIDLDDDSTLIVTVAMYGGIRLVLAGISDDRYDAVARETPSPLEPGFCRHAASLFAAAGADRLSVKALLATEQRMPGLGNGVLQDILWSAGINPRQRVGTLGGAQRRVLLTSVCSTLGRMIDGGGRDTEPDLYGQPGGYPTAMSRAALDRGCPRCGEAVQRTAFLGGNVYTCPTCQPLR
jgi:formamidopyrimidine-DNA glycosylase